MPSARHATAVTGSAFFAAWTLNELSLCAYSSVRLAHPHHHGAAAAHAERARARPRVAPGTLTRRQTIVAR